LKVLDSAHRPLKVLMIQHVSWEGPGIISAVLRKTGSSVQTVRLFRGEKVPTASVQDGAFDAVVGLGSPSTAYEPATNPAHYDEIELHTAVRRKAVPSFNICYSMQLFCVAHGGKVAKNPNGKEVGFHEVRLTPQGEKDLIFGPVGDHRMLQWHGDAVLGLPPGAVCLGRSDKTRNQLALVDGIHYLVQGDGQAATPSMIRSWFRHDGGWATEDGEIDEASVMAKAMTNRGYCRRVYSKIFESFLELAGRKRSGQAVRAS
jgi:GMP synthase (glutamine-hydrolysing)